MKEEWIIDITKQLKHSDALSDKKSQCKSIYRVPKFLKDASKTRPYEPRLASFGPYHYGSHYLRHMEQYKHHALIRYLRRIDRASRTLEDVIIAMRQVESYLLASYDSLDIDEEDGSDRRQHLKWLKEKDEFVKLMIVDGCFILEFMLAQNGYTVDEQSDYNSQDPVFGNKENCYFAPILKTDMLLLENQIPFLALSTLADIDGSKIGDVSELIRYFYNLPSASPEDPILANQCFHILDLYKMIMNVKGSYLPSYEKNIRSVTELRNLGVSFRRSKSRSFRDISFNNGVLFLPQLEIIDTTESLLLNLMAFERMQVTAGNEVTAYAAFMDGLIDTANDVALLRNKEIIIGWVGSDDNIAKIFNRISKEPILMIYADDMHMQENVDRNLNNYCKKRKNRLMASFMRTYCMNPWVFFSLLGAVVLLTLALLQTIYTLLPYYKKKKL